MKALSHHDIFFVILLGATFLIIGVLVGRFGFKKETEVPKIEISKYNNAIDSLYLIIQKSQKREDSLESVIRNSNSEIKNNHIKLSADVKKIRDFNDTTRNRFRDSVKRANGIE